MQFQFHEYLETDQIWSQIWILPKPLACDSSFANVVPSVLNYNRFPAPLGDWIYDPFSIKSTNIHIFPAHCTFIIESHQMKPSFSAVVQFATIAILVMITFSTNMLGQPRSEDSSDGPIEKRSYTTAMAKGALVIDGAIDEASWNQVEWSSDFIQREPIDGAAPTLKTAFKILYDNRSFYVAIRCFDPEPDKIVRRMSRRDGFEGDWVEINIDSYHDLRTAFSFTASVSGVKGDELVSQDGNNWDTSWNPIWNFKSKIDSAGWVAEIAIPLSQLRFDKAEEQVWGIQFTRRDFRNESRSNWQYNPQNSGVWVSAFGELHGIKNIKPKRQIEIQPYILGQYDVSKKVPGNPFRDGSDATLSGGLDGKIGITNDLTLDFTVNPDFGQVEADPSALNLDGFEIFFEERRPFFVENRNVFNYNISNSNAGGNYDSDNLFYSRRIGAAPHLRYVDIPSENIYVDQPDFSSILGAAKFSGKTNNGLAIGVLESVTRKEKATIRRNGVDEFQTVEPLTSYSVIRGLQDINEGNTVVGVIATGVNRQLDDISLDDLHQNAYSGGADLLHQWNNKKWRLNASFVGSRVAGSQQAILRTQTGFGHAFNRPDADHLEVDSAATSLSGTGANLSLGNYGNRIQYQIGATYRSPGLELNDIGFLRNADEINQYLWVGLRWNKPFSIFRSFRFNFNQWARWDFGGQPLYQAFNANIGGNFQNFWSINGGLNFEVNDISNTWLRNGPSFRKPQGFGGFLSVGTDSRKRIQQSARMNGGRGYDGTSTSITFGTTTSLQISDGLNISLGVNWNRGFRKDQYVTSREFNENQNYIVGEILRKTLSFTLRANFNITPDLTIQYYGQPYISRAGYSDFKLVADPLAQNVNKRLVSFTDDQLIATNNNKLYSIDQDRNGSIDYSFFSPDFEFVQFRSNLVARWEYIPGSEIFLVWSQGSSAFENDFSGNIVGSLGDNLWDDSLVNTFLVKITYRFTN